MLNFFNTDPYLFTISFYILPSFNISHEQRMENMHHNTACTSLEYTLGYKDRTDNHNRDRNNAVILLNIKTVPTVKVLTNNVSPSQYTSQLLAQTHEYHHGPPSKQSSRFAGTLDMQLLRDSNIHALSLISTLKTP
jgi:hypothetical protein